MSVIAFNISALCELCERVDRGVDHVCTLAESDNVSSKNQVRLQHIFMYVCVYCLWSIAHAVVKNLTADQEVPSEICFVFCNKKADILTSSVSVITVN